MGNSETGVNYASKLDDIITQSATKWFDSLSKQELLQFLNDRDDITADALREMLKHENAVLGFGIQFDVANGKASADFGLPA